MPTVKFVNEKIEIQVPVGANLRTEAKNAGVQLYSGPNKLLNCHGFGFCGSCRVLITKGIDQVAPMGTIEKFTFHNPFPDPRACMAFIGNEANMRLACQTTVQGDMEVVTHPPLNLFGDNFFS
ncbi:MAG TPA: ferredoxin [Pirellulales bacterium]|jgi:ferredoxin|nr:ferredoxin [Pirellulales bacterium]